MTRTILFTTRNAEVNPMFVKLRDKYSTFDELCDDLDVEKAEIEKNLKSIGYEYSSKSNQFK